MLGYKPLDDLPRLADEVIRGKLPLQDFITHRIKFDDINQAFDLIHSGDRYVPLVCSR